VALGQARELPFCQLGDTPLVVLGADAEPTRALHGMRGALQTRYVAGVVWELPTAQADQLHAQLLLFKETGYAVFAVYKDERTRSEVRECTSAPVGVALDGRRATQH
jgi:hypothetical protein